MRRILKFLRLQSSGCTRCAGGRGKGGAGLEEKERNGRAATTAHNKKAQGLLVQMRAPWGEAKKRHLLKSPLPKMPASTPCIWQMGDDLGGGGGRDATWH